MLGNPFSPYYARARRRGPADPLDFVALNVALYGRAGRWALTERRGLERSAEHLTLGRSVVRRTPSGLRYDLDEVTAIAGRRVRGTVDVTIEETTGKSFALDAAGRHRWSPVAPGCHVAVRLSEPSIGFTGRAYFDANAGEEPLERAFSRWDWSRASAGRRTRIGYHVVRRDGSTRALDLAVERGRVAHTADVIERPLPPTLWRLPRTVRGPRLHEAREVRALEDTPFYSRSQLALSLDGERHDAVHESLSLDRLTSRWVELLVPVRMRRAP